MSVERFGNGNGMGVRFLTTDELAKMLNVCAKSIQRATRRKVRPMPSYKILNTRRFRLDEVLEWLAEDRDRRQSDDASLGMFLGTFGEAA